MKRPRDILREVRTLANQMEDSITLDTVFQSPEFRTYVTSLVEGITKRYGANKVFLDFFFAEDSKFIAATENRKIMLNLANSLRRQYRDLEAQFKTNLGLIFHECSHIVFLDFDTEYQLEHAVKMGEFPANPPVPANDTERVYLDELKDALKNPQLRPIFMDVYHNLSNCFADPNNENRLMDAYGSLVQECVMLQRDGMNRDAYSLEDMEAMAADGNYNRLSIVFSLLLQWGTFGSFLSANQKYALEHSEYCHVIRRCSSDIEKAVETNDPWEKYSCINQIVLAIWPEIRAMLANRQQNQPQQGPGSKSQQGQGSQSQQSQGNQSQQSQGNQSQQGQDAQSQQGQGDQSQQGQGDQSQQGQGNQSQQGQGDQSQQGQGAQSQQGQDDQSQQSPGAQSQQGQDDQSQGQDAQSQQGQGSQSQQGQGDQSQQGQGSQSQQGQDDQSQQSPGAQSQQGLGSQGLSGLDLDSAFADSIINAILNALHNGVEGSGISTAPSSSTHSSAEAISTSIKAHETNKSADKADSGADAANGNASKGEEAKDSQKSADGSDSSKDTKDGKNHDRSDDDGSEAEDGDTSRKASILSSLISAIAQRMAEEQLDSEVLSDVNMRIKTVNMTSAHNDVHLQLTRHKTVSDAAISKYEAVHEQIAPYCNLLVRKMKDALKDLKKGSVNKHRIYGQRVEATDGYRPDQKYFSSKKLPSELPEMAVAVLIDNSGSMFGNRIEAATKAALLLHEFCRSLRIPCHIAGHHTDTDGVVYEVFSDFDSVGMNDAYRIASMSAGGCNRDGMAISICEGLLAKRREEFKLFIIISDGQPNHRAYGGVEAARDIQSIVGKYRRRGIECYAAAIGDDKDMIEAIYKDGFVDISDLSLLPKTLVGLVKKSILKHIR